MGSVWSGDEPIRLRPQDEEDLVALMAMDGATCIVARNGQEPHIEFRCLLSPIDLKEGVVERFREHAHDERYRLRGAGSRRWSAALTALSESVALVLVVSQDGDVHAWIRSEGKDKKHKVQHVVYKPEDRKLHNQGKPFFLKTPRIKSGIARNAARRR